MFVLSGDESLFCVFEWQLQEEVDALADRMELSNNALKGDWSHWKNGMRTDFKLAFISTAEKNVDYYEKVKSQSYEETFFRLKRQVMNYICTCLWNNRCNNNKDNCLVLCSFNSDRYINSHRT